MTTFPSRLYIAVWHDVTLILDHCRQFLRGTSRKQRCFSPQNVPFTTTTSSVLDPHAPSGPKLADDQDVKQALIFKCLCRKKFFERRIGYVYRGEFYCEECVW